MPFLATHVPHSGLSSIVPRGQPSSSSPNAVDCCLLWPCWTKDISINSHLLCLIEEHSNPLAAINQPSTMKAANDTSLLQSLQTPRPVSMYSSSEQCAVAGTHSPKVSTCMRSMQGTSTSSPLLNKRHPASWLALNKKSLFRFLFFFIGVGFSGHCQVDGLDARLGSTAEQATRPSLFSVGTPHPDVVNNNALN
jgi:hypothetical protein